LNSLFKNYIMPGRRVYDTVQQKLDRTPNRGDSWSTTIENTDIHLCGWQNNYMATAF